MEMKPAPNWSLMLMSGEGIVGDESLPDWESFWPRLSTRTPSTKGRFTRSERKTERLFARSLPVAWSSHGVSDVLWKGVAMALFCHNMQVHGGSS